MYMFDVLSPVNLPQTTEEAIEIKNGGENCRSQGDTMKLETQFGTFRKVEVEYSDLQIYMT